jgi:hypothetical protein
LVAMLEVLGWSAEDQQSKPLTLGIGGHVVEWPIPLKSPPVQSR